MEGDSVSAHLKDEASLNHVLVPLPLALLFTDPNTGRDRRHLRVTRCFCLGQHEFMVLGRDRVQVEVVCPKGMKH